MARNFTRKERLSAVSELNVTPLIDLAFALLIIFMITAPLLQQSIDINLPVETPRAQPPQRTEIQVISIDANRQLFWGNEAVDRQRLSDLLDLIVQSDDPPVIQLRGDATLPYQEIVNIIDLIKSKNLTRLSLETRAR